MRTYPPRIALLGILLFGFGVPGSSSADTNCDKALVMSVYTSASSASSDFRLADLVDSDTYSAVKADIGVNGSLFGIPLGASYGDYHSAASHYMQQHSESLSTSQMRNIAWMGLDPNAPSIYRTCVENNVFNGPGLHAAVIGATATDISIIVKLDIPNGPQHIQVTWTSGSASLLSSIPNDIPQGETTIVIARPSAETQLAGNWSGYTTSPIVLEPFPPPTVNSAPAIQTAPAASALPGMYGFENSNNKDRELELRSHWGAFKRIPANGDFGALCRSINLTCAWVGDWEGKYKPCSENPYDGSRLAKCQ